MYRWPVLTACAMTSVLGGCSPSLQPGLANAPRLGGTGVADERVNDVVSNGADSCGRREEEGPLRYRVPPCPTATHPVASTIVAPEAGLGGAPSESLVVPWLQHFYVGCPFTHAPAFAENKTMKAIAWEPALAPGTSCPSR